MHRTFVVALGVLLLPVMPAAADNFEFTVAGEPGLTLNVVGYDSTGRQMFEATTSKPEQRDGKDIYIVRVDEKILNSAPLSRWCVEDLGGTWSLLADKDGATGLCDDDPSETRGSYGFKATSVLGAAEQPDDGILPGMSVAEASACVQEKLNLLGFDAGSVDGQMGRRTFDAAIAFATAQDGDAYPELSNETAAQWCATMLAAIEGDVARGPSDDLARYRFGPDIEGAIARDTRAGIAAVDEYFRKVFGAALTAPGTIYVSSDADWLADAYVAHLKAGQGIRGGKVEWFSGCHGGEAGYGFMFMCAKADVFSGDWFGAGVPAQRSFALAHEYFHMLQYERAVGSLAGCCSGVNTLEMLGPQWLVEGAAEYIAFRMLGDNGAMDLQREVDWHTQKAGEVSTPLVKMETREGYYAEERASSSGMIAAHLLAESSGLASLAQFYDEIGAGKDWEVAFQDAFGLTPAEFYASYDRQLGKSPNLAQGSDGALVDSSAKCVQAALNELGFDAGSVDGKPGAQTQAALDDYSAAHPGQARMPRVDNAIAQNSWCLYLSANHDLTEEVKTMADELAGKARFQVALNIDPDAPFSVTFVDEATRQNVYQFATPVEYLTSSERFVGANYSDIRDAETICVVMMEGWEVIGQDGKIYPLSCTRLAFEMFSTVEPHTGRIPELTINVRAPSKGNGLQ
ncbi:peptidoglycan-binding domain-containing protein [Devosia sp. XGJD_8]|uniref:peptidoglycan-binding domain-containing protein n=1 Tax=Devosia sp. XGJD_8 TaxID=3391187 RepID=UPI0039847129